MVNLFEFSVNVIEMFIVLLFLTLYFGCKYNGIKKVSGFLIALIISVATITYLNSLYIYEGFLSLVFIIIYFLYSLFFLKGDIYIKLFMSGFINCIVYFIALFSTLLAAELLTNSYDALYGMTAERVILILLAKILLITACCILLKFKFNDIVRRRNMIILIIMPVVAELSMVGIMQVFLQYSELKSELLLSTVSVMLANFLTYYIFIKMNKDVEIETELNAIQQKYENDRKHAQDIEELYSKTCGIRHDLLLHFTTLKGFLDSDIDKAKDYIQTVTQNQLEEIKNFVKTDNDCFDAIVNAKIALCDKLNIDVQTRVMNHSLDALRHDEIAIIFGNLFDNAIEASKKSQKKMIELDVQIQGKYLSIMMANSIDRSVLDKNKALLTTKNDKHNHGYGIRNIQHIVNEHSGMIDYFEKQGYFYCDIYI